MATQFELIMLVVAAVAGGVINAILGWADAQEPFNARKFFATVVRAAVGAATSAWAFQGIVNVDVWIYLQAFGMGAGIDVLGQRLQKVLQPTPP